MLIFSKDVKPEWRTYDPGVEVLIAPLTKAVVRDCRKQATNRNGEIDEMLLDRLLCQRATKEWKGVGDSEGKELPATPEIIDMISDHLITFSTWIIREGLSLAEKQTGRKEELAKNYSSSHDGSAIVPGE